MSNNDGMLLDPNQNLDVVHHDAPERHIIGRTLLAPQLTKPIGTAASPGTSDAVAREDHVHTGNKDWIVYSAFDLFFDIGGYSTGNAIKFAQYQLDGNWMQMEFSYKIGSTTAFPAHYIRIKTPFNLASGVSLRIPVGGVLAYDASTGLNCTGSPVISPSDSGGTYIMGSRTYQAGGTFSGSMENFWNQFSPAWPFRSGTDVAEAWAVNDEISGLIGMHVILP